MRLNFGDVDIVIEAHVRGLRPPQVVWKIGPVRRADTVPPTPSPHRTPSPHIRKARVTMALLDNQKVSFSVFGADEVGNPVPLTGTPVFSVDRPDILNLVDNGNGSGVVSATGVLGTAVLSVTDTETNGAVFAGSVSVDVLPGDVTSVSIALGTPEHI